MIEQSKRIDEIVEFISQYKIHNPFANGAARSAYLSFERDLQAVLLWGLALDLYATRPLNDAETFLKEALSDVSTSNFCALTGLYKPAMMSLRSAIENFVKSFLCDAQSASDLSTSVYQLNIDFRAKFVSEVAPIKALSNHVVSQYGDLCKHTHSAGPD